MTQGTISYKECPESYEGNYFTIFFNFNLQQFYVGYLVEN